MPVVDVRTQYLSLPLPSLANDTADDCLRLIAALEALDAKAEGMDAALASADHARREDVAGLQALLAEEIQARHDAVAQSVAAQEAQTAALHLPLLRAQAGILRNANHHYHLARWAIKMGYSPE